MKSGMVQLPPAIAEVSDVLAVAPISLKILAGLIVIAMIAIGFVTLLSDPSEHTTTKQSEITFNSSVDEADNTDDHGIKL
jgi:hypothetical protein